MKSNIRDGIEKRCTGCYKVFPTTLEFFYANKSKSGLKARCKECYKKDRDSKKQWRKEYDKQYNNKNKDRRKLNNALFNKKQAKFKTYHQNKELILIEEIRQDTKSKELLQVKCAYCGKWFNPTNLNIAHRIQSIRKVNHGESRFYCSDNCKIACPIFNQYLYPKGFKKATSREVQPELRQMVLKRDNYTCQKCGVSTDQAELHCHHITGVVQNPIESADIDNCITFCKKCHKAVHKEKGCKYHELRCNKEQV